MKQSRKIAFNTQVSEIELSYKLKTKISDRRKIEGSRDTVDIFREHWNTNTIELQEEVKVLYLNRTNHVLGIYDASRGSVTGAAVDCKLILGAAFLLAASYLVICHNHPSGNLKPSYADKHFTEKLKNGAALVDICLLDHIIITTENYFSFAEEGLI